jgi:hypothetical protein
MITEDLDSFDKSKSSKIFGSEEVSNNVETLKSLYDKKSISLKEFELLLGLICVIEYEKKNKDFPLDIYVDVMNAVINPHKKLNPCNGCGGAMLKVHNSFQNYIWKNLKKENLKWIIPTENYNVSKFQSSFWIGQIEIMSINDLRVLERSLNNDIVRLRRIGNKSQETLYVLDSGLMIKYLTSKMNYFKEHFLEVLKGFEVVEPVKPVKEVENIELSRDVEVSKELKTKRKVKSKKFLEDDEKILFQTYLKQGKSLKECAELFDISLKFLSNLKAKIFN